MKSNPTVAKDYLEEFHSLSKEVSVQFDKFILSEFKKREDKDQLSLLYKKFLDSKIGRVHQRAVFVFIAAKVFGLKLESDMSKFLPLMAVPELTIWSNYALNWVTDGKNNVSGTKLEENVDIIASQYLLTEVVHFLPERMLKRFLEIYRWIMRGYLSVEVDLSIANFENMEDDKAFWIAYSRNHCIPDVGALYAYCFDIVEDYFELQVEEKTKRRIEKIMLEFGRALQINGDLSDFIIPNEYISTTEKRPQKDYFIDIRTNRLTYPVWLLMKWAKKNDSALFEEIKRVAKDNIRSESFYNKVHEALREGQIIKEGLEYVRKEKNRLTKEIDKLGIQNEGIYLWKASFVVLTANKFARQLKEDYGL